MIKRFLGNWKLEFKEIVWPKSHEVSRISFFVIAALVLVSILVYVVDKLIVNVIFGSFFHFLG